MRCAGFIIFDLDNMSTVMVQTHKGNWGFPKGKKEGQETLLETAYRELEEETGITSDQIEVLDHEPLIEKSAKGHPSVAYYLAHVTSPIGSLQFVPDELALVEWVPLNKACCMNLKKGRTDCLKEAMVAFSLDPLI